MTPKTSHNITALLLERCKGLPSRSQAQGNAVGLLCGLGTCYGIYLKGHVTERSHPTVPSGPFPLAMSSSSACVKLLNRSMGKSESGAELQQSTSENIQSHTEYSTAGPGLGFNL